MQLFLKNEITLYVYKKHYIVCSGRDPGEINIEAHVRNSKKKIGVWYCIVNYQEPYDL